MIGTVVAKANVAVALAYGVFIGLAFGIALWLLHRVENERTVQKALDEMKEKVDELDEENE